MTDKNERPIDLLAPSFPILVRTARSVLGWSQAELAKNAGVASQSISRVERFERAGRIATLRKIETALNAAGVHFMQKGSDFGLMIEGEVSERLQSEVRQQQNAETPGEVRGPSRARVYGRRVDLSEPPKLGARPRRKRHIDIGNEEK